MVEALGLGPGDRVLEIGAGSGYAAAVLSRIAGEVVAVERHEALARSARERLAAMGYRNVTVIHADGSLGWPEAAPYDAILVSAGGPQVPPALLAQLLPGGRLVMPVGAEAHVQDLLLVTRLEAGGYQRESLDGVSFVPLLGAGGWAEQAVTVRSAQALAGETSAATLVAEEADPIGDIEGVALDALLDRIGEARVVLIGEGSHGTSEFYRLRARITRELVARRGFGIVAAEADWPDAARIDHYVRPATRRLVPAWTPFDRFPTWMWRNRETAEFVEWLRAHNAERPADGQAGFYGLDLYSLYRSVDAVLGYLDEVDPQLARLARERYGCLTPWQGDPATYGRLALSSAFHSCEPRVLANLQDLLERRLDYAAQDGDRFLDAAQNARLVASAERYYRIMYYGGAASWNLRDEHMFDTLERLLEHRGPEARAVVWAHNSHIGDAAATSMWARGELNIGHLCRRHFGEAAFAIGFGTDHGTVAAAQAWGGPLRRMDIRPALAGSIERLCHESEVPAFLLYLR
jgi:protein-L-isoaspartate(D-aspartate) O-methyltransferase